MALDPVIFRTPILDASGKLTREWIRFFQDIQSATGTIQNIQNTTVIQGQASAFDDVPTRDITREIVNTLLASVGEPSVKAPADESVIDWTPSTPAQIDPLAALHLQDTPREHALDITALLLTMDSPRINGVDGTISLAKLTTGGVNGSITVTNGVITAFTNPS